ncbi:hypothetical protein Gocc_1764 [Gaiella occulta]|uniref:Uncharacterized protein n=1 Tax=Gaiella occulta TaxID=1002870 RepID=A0A7M2YXZ9_9ACTN|nr:hypothetical protein [Gaiella occulta]RDI74875.1 hypothetical protein Gocc_1764 [Gaiella occulta]
MRARHLVLLAACASLFAPAGAPASALVDRDARAVKLQVNAAGQALLSYEARGKKWNVLAWGAVNAIAPTPARRQVEFKLDYSGGWGTYRKDVWKSFRNTCGPYSGPPLAWLVTACTARDGSHWAVQSWQRALPNYGLRPTPRQAVWELRLSHWTGPLPELTVRLNWAYRKFDHIFGSFTYNGSPVHGFQSTSVGEPLDTFGRNLYVDTFNSAYGAGWKRENSFLTHKGTGTFCYGFYPHGSRPAGKGERYRATIIGPGVTPDVMWQGEPLGSYNQALDLELHEQQRALYGSDTLCKPV